MKPYVFKQENVLSVFSKELLNDQEVFDLVKKETGVIAKNIKVWECMNIERKFKYFSYDVLGWVEQE